LTGRFLIYFLAITTIETFLALSLLFIFLQDDAARLEGLDNNSVFLASALADGALENTQPQEEDRDPKLNFQKSQEVLRRFSRAQFIHTRVVSPERKFIADNRFFYDEQDFTSASSDKTLRPPALHEKLADDLLLYLMGLGREKSTHTFSEIDHLLIDPNLLDEVQKAFGGVTENKTRLLTDKKLFFTSAAPIMINEEVIGVVVSSDKDFDVTASRRNLLFDVLTALVCFIFASAILMVPFLWSLTLPFEALKRTSKKIQLYPTNAGIRFEEGTRLDKRVSGLSSALHEMVEGFRMRIEAMDKFSSDVSHEIRRPLTSLKSAVETMSRLNNEVERKDLMSIVLSDTDRLDRLVSDISDFSRLGNELDNEMLGIIDLAELVPQVCQNIETSSGGGEIRFSTSGSDNYVIKAHPDRFIQVLENILTNALSFSPPETSAIVSLSREDDGIRITVDDEGPGIPEENLNSVFDRFYSSRPEGDEIFHSGLGLAISQQIIGALGGKIWVENRRSNEGHVTGARFVIDLAPGE